MNAREQKIEERGKKRFFFFSIQSLLSVALCFFNSLSVVGLFGDCNFCSVHIYYILVFVFSQSTQII